MSDDPYRKKMMGLNLTQMVLGIVIAAGTIISVFAAYITLPAKVVEIQSSQTNIWQHINKISSDRTDDRELLIRIDERTKSIKADLDELKAASKDRRLAQPNPQEESSRQPE